MPAVTSLAPSTQASTTTTLHSLLKSKMSKIIAVRAVGRERTEEEKLRRHLHGDKGAKFSKVKRMCILGDVCSCVTTFATKDNIVAEFYED